MEELVGIVIFLDYGMKLLNIIFQRFLDELNFLKIYFYIKHDVFKSNVFTGMNEFVLSTSTLNSDAVSLGAFGPVVEGGFGVGYIVYPDWMGVSISAFKVE